jgi:hypothetical protein
MSAKILYGVSYCGDEVITFDSIKELNKNIDDMAKEEEIYDGDDVIAYKLVPIFKAEVYTTTKTQVKKTLF